MKVLLTFLTLTISLNSFATEWLTYYVYFETEYPQGTWTRTNILEQSNYKYLTVEAYEDLFGSRNEQLVDKFLSRLKTKKPDLYQRKYDLTFQGDTVVITTKENPKNIETIKNEIIATLIFNNFKAVQFNFGGKSETLTNNDLTVPYFDLVSKQTSQTTNTTKMEESSEQNESIEPTETKNPLTTWLIVSIIFNLALFVLLTMKQFKKQVQ
jgi:hypothetical protein